MIVVIVKGEKKVKSYFIVLALIVKMVESSGIQVKCRRAETSFNILGSVHYTNSNNNALFSRRVIKRYSRIAVCYSFERGY